MSELRVASRYAKSLLELAKAQEKLDEVHSDMLLFTKVCDENRDFLLMLRNPIVNHDKKLRVLKAVFEGHTCDITMGLFDVVTRKNRESFLPTVAKDFHLQYLASKNIEQALVVTPFPLDDTLRARFLEVTKGLAGREVELEEKVDESILGGFVLRIGDRQVDETLDSKLRELRLQFNDGSYERAI